MSEAASAQREITAAGLRGHVVILNCSPKVRRLVSGLHAATAPAPVDVALLIQDLTLWKAHPEWHPTEADQAHFFIEVGCPTDGIALARVGLERAAAALILADPRHGRDADARSTLVAVAVEQQSPQVHTVMELLDSVHRAHLRATEVNEVVCLGDLTEKLLAQSCITPGIKNVFDRLLTARPGGEQIMLLPLPPALQGQRYRALAQRALAAGAELVLLGFVTAPSRGRRHVLNPRAGIEPGKDTLLQAGDGLIVLARTRPDLESALAGPG